MERAVVVGVVVNLSGDPVAAYRAGEIEHRFPAVGTPSLADPGIVTFTMDSSTYAISVSGPDTSFSRNFRFNAWPAHASVTGNIGAPLYAPRSTTTAAHARRSAGSTTVR